MAFRYLAPALAVAGTAAAACSGTTTISNSADAMALSTCYTYSGDIAIATGTTDDIALDGIRRIQGSLTVKNVPSMASLSGDSLAQIDDTFELNGVQALSTLNFPMLSSAATVNWVALPVLGGLSFTAGLQKVGSLSIVNTNLQSLDGIALETVNTLTLTNNPYLNDINMPLTMVGSAMTLASNGDNTNANFQNLKWAYNMSIANCEFFNFDSLTTLNGSIGFYSNYLQTISLPNLTYVGSQGGGLSFVDNAKLTNISVPGLKAIGGGLAIANNTDLQNVNGFPRLTNVYGAVVARGNFKSLSFPSLNDVRGAFDILSSQNIQSSCNKFNSLHGGRAAVIKGEYQCKSGQSKSVTGTTNHGGSSSSSSSGSTSSSSGAANAVYISGATGVLGVIAAVFGML